MKQKTKEIKSVLLRFILIVVFAVGCVVVFDYLGIGTMRSAVRIGYVGNDIGQNWSASYVILDGKMKHTIRLEDEQKSLHVEVVTEDGSISIEMKDKDGNSIFNKDNIQTSSLDVAASEKVVVYIDADEHKGSFNIKANGTGLKSRPICFD